MRNQRDKPVLVRSVSRARLRAATLTVGAVVLLVLASADGAGRRLLAPMFLFFFVLTLVFMSYLLRFLLRRCLRAEGPLFIYTTKKVSLRDEDVPVLIDASLSILVGAILVPIVPEVGGILGGVYAGLASMFALQGILLTKAERTRQVVFWEPSAMGNAPPGCYTTSS